MSMCNAPDLKVTYPTQERLKSIIETHTSMICQHVVFAEWLDWTNQIAWQQMHIDKPIKKKEENWRGFVRLFCSKMNCDAIKCVLRYLKSTLIVITGTCDSMHLDTYDAILQFPIVLFSGYKSIKKSP